MMLPNKPSYILITNKNIRRNAQTWLELITISNLCLFIAFLFQLEALGKVIYITGTLHAYWLWVSCRSGTFGGLGLRNPNRARSACMVGWLCCFLWLGRCSSFRCVCVIIGLWWGFSCIMIRFGQVFTCCRILVWGWQQEEDDLTPSKICLVSASKEKALLVAY